MGLFRRASISRKITLLTLITATTALVLAFTAFIIYDYFSCRNMVRQELSSLADATALSLAELLVRGDHEKVVEVVDVLGSMPHVVQARVYLPDGHLVASSGSGSTTTNHSLDSRVWGEIEGFSVFRPMFLQDKLVGNIYIKSSTHLFSDRLAAYLQIAAIFLLLAPLVSIGLISRLRRMVSEPVIRLSHLARRVSSERNYTLRATSESQDEVGVLVDSFNTMLDQIQARNSHLTHTRVELEENSAKLRSELAQHRKTEERLRLFSSVAEASGLGMGITDLIGNFVYMNPALCRMLGIRDDKGYAGKSLESVFDGANLEKIRHVAIPAILSSGHWQGELDIAKMDGINLPTIQNAFLIRHDDGSPAYMAGIVTDISELKRAQENLRKSEERLNNAQKVAHIGSWELDMKTRTIWASDEAFSIYGIDPNTADRRFARTQNMVVEEDRAFKDEALRRFIENDEPYDIEFRIHRESDGAERYVHSRGHLIRDEHGNPIRGEGIVQDVTDRRRAVEELHHHRQMLQLVLNNIPQRVFWKDRDLNYLGCNRQFAQDAGLVDSLEIIGKSDYDLSWKGSAHRYRSDDTEVIVADKPKINFEEQQIRTDGTELWLRTSKIPLHDRNHHVIGVLGTYEDITEQKKAEAHRRQLQEKLERAERMESLGILAGGVAHDLNNMLGPLVGYPELILRKLPDDSPVRKQVMRIGRSAQEAADVIQDLLTLARRGRYEMVPTNVNEVIRDYLDSPSFIRLREGNPQVEIDIKLYERLRPIRGSSSHLAKVFMNLIVNAFDAMPGGGRLVVESSEAYLSELASGHDKVANGEYVLVRVADNGMGIDQADLSKIFEPYYSKKKMGRSGSGLGLSVVYGIVKDHKGYYDVLTRKGEGTQFILYFPVCAEECPAAIGETLDVGGNETILVVDDIADQREIASEMLACLGYRVSTATNGREALAWLRNHQVDLVVLDMIMENDFDGLDTYREILKIRPGQPAIIVSGFSPTDRVNETQQLGAGLYVKKPYTLEALGGAVRRELNAAKLSQAPNEQAPLVPGSAT